MAKVITSLLRNVPSGCRKLYMRRGSAACYLCSFSTNRVPGSLNQKQLSLANNFLFYCDSNQTRFPCFSPGGHFANSKGFSSSSVCLTNGNKLKEEDAKVDNEKHTTNENPEKPLSQRQKLARTFAAYGTTGVVFHTCISLTSLGTCYMIVSSGIDMVSLLEKIGIASKAGMQSTLASGASTFVIAYACHKVFMPVRIFLTVTCTPLIVTRLKSLGFLKNKAKVKTSGS